MNLYCLIVDDEPLAHNVIIKYCADLNYLNIKGQTYGPTEALSLIKEREFDIIFLDIKMPKMTGLEWLSLSKPDAQIIITSAYGEFALESYELNVCDYLLKPFSYSRFLKATEKAKEKLSFNTRLSSHKSMLIKVDKKLIKVDQNDITHIESYGNYVKVHLRDKMLMTLRTMSSLVSEMQNQDFIQVHKSYLINRNHFYSIEGNMITLKTGYLIPLSRQFKTSFLDKIKP